MMAVGINGVAKQDVVSMSFASAIDDIIVVPAVGADLDFPSVVIAGLPADATIIRVDMILIIGAILDTSSAENQIKVGTTDAIYVKKSSGAWGTDDISALVFQALGLQVAADGYRGGAVIFGATDIKSEVDGNGTYNFRSEETNRTKGVEATGGTLELLDVSIVVRVWFKK